MDIFCAKCIFAPRSKLAQSTVQIAVLIPSATKLAQSRFQCSFSQSFSTVALMQFQELQEKARGMDKNAQRSLEGLRGDAPSYSGVLDLLALPLAFPWIPFKLLQTSSREPYTAIKGLIRPLRGLNRAGVDTSTRPVLK